MPTPEKIPFMRTICIGSFEAIRRVQLLSKPQQKAAKITYKEPEEKRRLSISSQESTQQESVTKAMPTQSRLDIRARKKSHARMAVATISKSLSREAFAAVVFCKPTMRQIGPTISKTIIART